MSKPGFKTIYCAALMCAVIATSAPKIATGQDASNASLVRRIEQLEKTNADLERRVRQLEMLLKNAPASVLSAASSSKARELTNWRRLRTGMSMNEVREILGEPERVEGGVVAIWYWTDGSVTYVSDKLASWSEPKR